MMRRTIVLLIVIIMAVSLCSCTSRNESVSDKIKSDFVSAELQIKMNDYTDFDWDTLIIYRNPITVEEINEVGDIDYKGKLDLTDGMIFVNKGQVVYEETFLTDFETPHEFMIFPYIEGYHNKEHINVFTPKTAVFNGTKQNYNGEHDYYTLYPVAS